MDKQKKESVVKSNLLIEAAYKLSAEEQKMVLLVATQVQPQDEDFKTYEFAASDIMQMLGKTSGDYHRTLERTVNHLMEKVVHIELPDGWEKYSWMSWSKYVKGEGKIFLRFDKGLKEHLLKLKSRFTKYHLKNVIKLRSQYSIRMYELLKQYQKIGERRFDLEDLRKRLGVEDKYDLYGHFKKNVILQAQEEMKTKTDLRFDFLEIHDQRKWHRRKIVAIKFTVKENNNPEVEELELPKPKELKSEYEELVSLGMNSPQAKEVCDLAQEQFKEKAGEYIALIVKRTMNGPERKNLPGYLYTALKNNIKGYKEQQDLKEEKKKKDRETLKKQEEEKEIIEGLQKKHAEYCEARVKKKMEKLTEDDQKEFGEKFFQERIAPNPVLRGRFNDSGLNGSMVKVLWQGFLQEKLLSEDDISFEKFAGERGYKVYQDMFESGKYRVAEKE